MALHPFSHPAHYYARYLALVLPQIGEVNDALRLAGLQEMDKHQLAAVVDAVKDPPADFRPWSSTDAASTRWLRAHKIYTFVHQDATAREAQQILSHHRIREAVERMLLGGVSHAEISYRLKGLGHSVTEAAVADFRHYFWNTEIMSAADWANYFREDRQGRTRDIQGQYGAALVSGPKFALYRSGVKVEVDRHKVLEEVHDELYFTFQEVRALPVSEKKIDMLASLARSLSRVDERLEAGDSALVDVLKKFSHFRVVEDVSTPPSVVDIAPTGTVTDRSRQQTREVH